MKHGRGEHRARRRSRGASSPEGFLALPRHRRRRLLPSAGSESATEAPAKDTAIRYDVRADKLTPRNIRFI